MIDSAKLDAILATMAGKPPRARPDDPRARLDEVIRLASDPVLRARLDAPAVQSASAPAWTPAAGNWDESKHPRKGKGQPGGGQFTSGAGGGPGPSDLTPPHPDSTLQAAIYKTVSQLFGEPDKQKEFLEKASKQYGSKFPGQYANQLLDDLQHAAEKYAAPPVEQKNVVTVAKLADDHDLTDAEKVKILQGWLDDGALEASPAAAGLATKLITKMSIGTDAPNPTKAQLPEPGGFGIKGDLYTIASGEADPQQALNKITDYLVDYDISENGNIAAYAKQLAQALNGDLGGKYGNSGEPAHLLPPADPGAIPLPDAGMMAQETLYKMANADDISLAKKLEWAIEDTKSFSNPASKAYGQKVVAALEQQFKAQQDPKMAGTGPDELLQISNNEAKLEELSEEAHDLGIKLMGKLSDQSLASKDAIQHWTTKDGYQKIQNHLNGIETNAAAGMEAKQLQDAILSQTLEEGVHAWRGVHGPQAMHLQVMMEGDEWTIDGFIPTTLDPKRATHYSKGKDLIHVSVPAGANALYVSHPQLNSWDAERELLLPAGTTLKYKAAKTINLPQYDYTGKKTGGMTEMTLHEMELVPIGHAKQQTPSKAATTEPKTVQYVDNVLGNEGYTEEDKLSILQALVSKGELTSQAEKIAGYEINHLKGAIKQKQAKAESGTVPYPTKGVAWVHQVYDSYVHAIPEKLQLIEEAIKKGDLSPPGLQVANAKLQILKNAVGIAPQTQASEAVGKGSQNTEQYIATIPEQPKYWPGATKTMVEALKQGLQPGGNPYTAAENIKKIAAGQKHPGVATYANKLLHHLGQAHGLTAEQTLQTFGGKAQPKVVDEQPDAPANPAQQEMLNQYKDPGTSVELKIKGLASTWADPDNEKYANKLIKLLKAKEKAKAEVKWPEPETNPQKKMLAYVQQPGLTQDQKIAYLNADWSQEQNKVFAQKLLKTIDPSAVLASKKAEAIAKGKPEPKYMTPRVMRAMELEKTVKTFYDAHESTVTSAVPTMDKSWWYKSGFDAGRQACDDYTGAAYDPINEALRTGETKASTTQLINDIDDMFEHPEARLQQDTLFWRGENFPEDKIKEFEEKLSKGLPCRYMKTGFISTSLVSDRERMASIGYQKNTHFKIIGRKGTSALGVAPIGLSGENETLFRDGQNFEVYNIEREPGGKTLISMVSIV